MTETAIDNGKLKQYKGNLIRQVLYKQSLKHSDPEAYLKEKRKELEEALNRTKRLGAILNNTFAPDLEELVIIAGVLKVKLDDLVQVE